MALEPEPVQVQVQVPGLGPGLELELEQVQVQGIRLLRSMVLLLRTFLLRSPVPLLGIVLLRSLVVELVLLRMWVDGVCCITIVKGGRGSGG